MKSSATSTPAWFSTTVRIPAFIFSNHSHPRSCSASSSLVTLLRGSPFFLSSLVNRISANLAIPIQMFGVEKNGDQLKVPQPGLGLSERFNFCQWGSP